MPITEQEHAELRRIAKAIRLGIVEVTSSSGGAHVGGSLSMVDILVILYWKYMNVDPSNPEWEDRDRFVLSKGHGGVGHSVLLAHKGYFDKARLKEYNQTGSML